MPSFLILILIYSQIARLEDQVASKTTALQQLVLAIYFI